jgi:hypothetical protein
LSKSVITSEIGNKLDISSTGEASVDVKKTVGIKSTDLNLDAEKDVQVDVKSDTSNQGWLAFAKADNAVASASKAGEAGKSHYITSVFASYTASLTSKGTLSIKDGITVIAEVDLESSRDVTFGKPVKITEGNAVSAELSASGTAGTIGKVNLTGFTV